jgi:ribosomal protein L16 Arg81 hydroxylase
MDRLNQFFGQDQSRQQQYQDFNQRYQQDPSQLSPQETARMYRQMADQLDPEDLDEAHEQAFAQMPDQERRQLAQQFQQWTQDPNRPYQGYPQDMDLDQAAQPRQLGRMMRQAGREDPDLLEQVVGPNSPLNSTTGKLALAGAAAFLASRFMGNQR